MPLCVDDMILDRENPRDSIQKLLDLKNDFSKVAGYKISINLSHFLTLTMKYEKGKVKKNF